MLRGGVNDRRPVRSQETAIGGHDPQYPERGAGKRARLHAGRFPFANVRYLRRCGVCCQRAIEDPRGLLDTLGTPAIIDEIQRAPEGALFENLVVMEALKTRYNRGRRSNLSFYRDSNGNEVDLVCSFADKLVGVEIKAGATVSGDYFKGLERLSAALPQPLSAKVLVYGGNEEHTHRGVAVTNPRGFAASLSATAEKLGADR